MKKQEPFYIMFWDVNHRKVELYDIIQYLSRTLKEEKKYKYKLHCNGKIPETFDEYKSFILSAARNFWGQCEYELSVEGFPPFGETQKIDGYMQIEMNIDVITRHFIEHL